MRRAEITPELIELSKKAKELGFPQDVERGDWVCDVTDDELYLIETLKEEGDALILSFSRCLEWLRELDYGAFSIDPAENPHETIAKAVIKILKGEE